MVGTRQCGREGKEGEWKKTSAKKKQREKKGEIDKDKV